MRENEELKNQLSLITFSLEEIYDQLNLLHKKSKRKIIESKFLLYAFFLKKIIPE
jgi:hypothetical protein